MIQGNNHDWMDMIENHIIDIQIHLRLFRKIHCTKLIVGTKTDHQEMSFQCLNP